jgi:hypothetical protein
MRCCRFLNIAISLDLSWDLLGAGIGLKGSVPIPALTREELWLQKDAHSLILGCWGNALFQGLGELRLSHTCSGALGPEETTLDYPVSPLSTQRPLSEEERGRREGRCGKDLPSSC